MELLSVIIHQAKTSTTPQHNVPLDWLGWSLSFNKCRDAQPKKTETAFFFFIWTKFGRETNGFMDKFVG